MRMCDGRNCTICVSFRSCTLPSLDSADKSGVEGASAGFPADGALAHQGKHPSLASNRAMMESMLPVSMPGE